jgi:hypothetical protein
LLLTAAVSLLLLLLPMSAAQVSGEPTEYQNLLTAEGPAVILPLAVPVLICAVPLLVTVRRRRFAAWLSTVLLAVGVLVSLLSIGVFFVPSLIVLAVGAGRSSS